MSKFLFFIALFIYSNTWSQTEFFNSKIDLDGRYLTDFYSSFSMDSTQIYFNANDYYVYAYDKKTGKRNWSYYANKKSNDAPKSCNNSVFINESAYPRIERTIQLNAKTGDSIKALKIDELTNHPFIKDSIMYCATVSPAIGGAILGYDLKNNNIVWEKYIGHGVSFQPYFFKDKIVANVENQYWFEVDYKGNLLDKSPTCYYINAERNFEETYCNIHYDLLNQYNKDVVVKNVAIENTKYYYADNVTIVLEDDKIRIINQKNKIKKEITIDKIIKLPETRMNDYREILKVEGDTVWLFYENTLAVYDFQKNKTIKTYDFSPWNAHQVILDGNNLWLISKKNGELVGLKLNDNL